MSACPQCGTENGDSARFCQSCGYGLERDVGVPLHVRKTVTILFCDVTGSTALGERQDPERLRRVMMRYFEVAQATLERHQGKVEKFIGDAVMAVFGVPVLHEDDALRALRAATDLQAAIRDLNVDLERTHDVRIEIRTGVNSGEVIAGDPTRESSIVSGDVLVVAERLQRSAAPGEILIGEETYRLARDAIRTEPLEPLVVKGKRDRVMAYRLLEVVPGAPAHARRFDSPMVGRKRELSSFEGAFVRACRGHSCHLFTVLGPAGVGKSRLVAEALASIGDRARVLSGSCLPYGEGITFWPVLEIVKQLTGITDDDSPAEAQEKIASVLAGDSSSELVASRVAQLIGLAETSATEEDRFWGLRRLLEALAHEQPLVVVFDDLNWAEPTLLDLVEDIADWSREAPILLVAMARPDLLDTRPAWGGGKHNATAIFLEPLSESEADSLVEGLLGGGTVEEEALARIRVAAEGNPLFVEEMISMLIDDGALRRDNGRWVAASDLSRVAAPSSIQVLLAARLDQLGAPERLVIERAAVEGTVFHRGAIEAMLDEPLRGEARASLGALLRKELIRQERAEFTGEDAFRFRHVLIRNAAYDALPKQVRAELHERFADWLEGATGDRTTEVEEVLGYHFEQAFRHRTEVHGVDETGAALANRGGRLLASAGRRAVARGDAPAAVNLLERAGALLPEDAPEWLELRLELADALHGAGDLQRVGELLEGALAQAERSGNAGIEARARLELVSLRPYVDPQAMVLEDMLQAAEHAADVLERIGDDAGLARSLRRIADVHWLRCRVGPGEPLLERALEHARRAGDERELSEIRRALLRAAAIGPMPVDHAIARCEAIISESPGDPVTEAVATNGLAYLNAMAGRFAEARELSARSREILEDLGLTLMLPTLDAWAGQVEMLAGDAAAAERLWRRAYQALEGLGEKGNLSTVAAFLAEAVYVQGRDDEAAELTGISESLMSRDDVTSYISWRSVRAKVAARRGEGDRGEALAREAVSAASESDWPHVRGGACEALAEVLAATGREKDARKAVKQALALYDAKGSVAAADRLRARFET
ncbi:MAG TPA: adenylate/guanylate cyclase domain-containing protein [Gaiellaceae bacterium]|nr:adenylate/guanylate cyclase domain-containing protein [Gaiellaceae bacterium]